jgi:hypothetical protein
MEAQIQVVASHLRLITSPEEIAAAIEGNLFVDHKKVLLIKGIPAATTVAAIYQEFAKRKDLRNQPFQISHKRKSLMMRNQWDELKKVELSDMRKFIEHWFVLAEKTEHNGKPVLLLVNTLPVRVTVNENTTERP